MIVPAVVIDRTNAASIEEAFQVSHDMVLQLLGPLRRSGVHWTEHYPKEALKIISDPTMAHWPDEATQQMKDLLADPRSILVVAWAIAALPPDTFIPVNQD